MQLLYAIASGLLELIKPGMSVSVIVPQICQLNDRAEFVLKELNFKPENVPIVELFDKSEDERMAIANHITNLCQESEILYLPYLYQAGIDFVSKRYRNDLSLFATDFLGQRGLRFIVATSSFGVPTTATLEPETEKERVAALLQSMTDKGYVIADQETRKALVNCDKNRALLKAYCETTLGATVTEFRSFKDTIRNFRAFLPLDKIQALTVEKPAETPPSNTITPDMDRMLKIELRHLIDATTFYDTLKNSNPDLILSNIQSTVDLIEKISGVHCSIYERSYAAHEITRNKNQAIRQIEAELKAAAPDKIGPRAFKLYDRVYMACEQFAKTLGMYPDEVVFMPHQRLRIELIPDQIGLFKGKTRAERAATPSMQDILAVQADIQKELPSVAITNWSAKSDRDTSFVIDKMTIVLNDMRDLLPLLQIYEPASTEAGEGGG